MKDTNVKLILADSFEFLEKLPEKSIDTIIADPPYFLINGGFSNSGGKQVSVNKDDWDKKSSEDAEIFYKNFIHLSKRCLKDNGTIWIFGTMHNIYTIGYLLKKDFKILNNITWQKSNPAPNLSKRMFTHSTETIIWAKKKVGHQLYNYQFMKHLNNDKQMKDVWTTPTIGSYEKAFGRHPTQKPLSVITRIIQASTDESSLILDPFVGSGTTAVAGKILNRKVIGIDNSREYLNITKTRIINIKKSKFGTIK
ncbi:DNA-methyltransferase [Companilactobacillus versmoldensis]|nr:site-specific DNA-methyltransferase [Companilactobacillus versmoldensis]